MPQLLLTFVLIGIGWFLLIRPQQARLREQKALVASLAVGDSVITAGGIHGTLTAVDSETVRIDVAPGVELTLARAAVSRRLGGALDASGAADSGGAQNDDLAPSDLGIDDDDGGDDRSPGRSGDDAEDNMDHTDDGPTTGGPA
ncbi:MAG: yajC [Acidimicrobiales bacterium]|nr:yajC [Acidimicrobiales bacterium]